MRSPFRDSRNTVPIDSLRVKLKPSGLTQPHLSWTSFFKPSDTRTKGARIGARAMFGPESPEVLNYRCNDCDRAWRGDIFRLPSEFYLAPGSRTTPVNDPRAVRYARRRKTDHCDQPILATGAGEPKIIRATDDPTEALERIVSRRKLLIDRGDIFISRAIAPIRGSDERDIYHLSRQDLGSLPGRYTSFEHAVVAGDELVTTHRVRLYFQESPDHPPQLLKDCRP